ncbi:TPA: HAMP domain-containing protein [Enterobacter hormaechei subsp. hoffmannii]|uniref:methyl-accepting chemotaxis protein n=1 Tax=Enterobacter TaxID=547 RepID=UPI000796468D|nr:MULTISPECIES: methyl-accepting chemotaxis protein [Enterobacter]MCA2401085.1 methyl-accepting chemotaxis protein [Enterobacter sp. CCUG 70166]CZX16023.1 methyl-accepting chemotaxis sensory transducer [Enterobacter hormaechei]HAS0825756.1 HAMP domain-containing protein [Enterobacter hormaechei subsp. hoffmannii]HAT7667021.1 HAMP domain-containing protein [Enterobacter hormaechei subsp. hoffmannii]
MLKTLSIRTGLLSLLAVMTLLLLIVSGIGIYALTQSSASLQRINHLQGEQMVQLNAGYTLILRARNEAGQAVRMMEVGLLDDAARAVKTINQEVALAQKTLKGVIGGGVADEQGQKLLDNVAASLAVYNQQGISPMLKALNEQSADGYYDLLESKLVPVAKQFDNDMQAFQTWSEARGKAEVSAVQASKTRVLILIIVAALLTAGIIVLAWLVLRHMLLKPLSASIAQLEHVAAGDLTHTLNAPASQEFNRLNAVIEEMRQSLMNSVLRVRDASSQIDTGSRELTAGNLNLAQRTESTATSLEQTAASMEEITATVKLNADNAGQAHQLAQSVSDTADHGSEMVCYVIEKMRDIAGSSARIADILSVIDGIAFQTNILALNASVEAARAGEQGRGFAVVAGEVRNLASRSADAAKEIRSLISDSQTHVNEGSELAQQAGETMDEIATEVLRMTKLMREIATASQEQSRGIEQVNIAVNQMDETVQQNAALVQQSSAATRSLEEQSRELMEAMASFKLTAQTA